MRTENSTSPVTTECKTAFLLDRDEKMRFLAGFFGNAVWAVMSGTGVDLRGQETTKFWPANWAQVLYVMPLPFLSYALYLGVIFCKQDAKKHDAAKKSVAGFVSLILGIFFWNVAQHYGEDYLYRRGLSDKNAGNAASIFTGLSDSIISAVFYDATLLLMREPDMLKRYQFFRTDCAASSLLAVIYFLTSSLGGAVWQLVYNSIFPNCAHTPKDCTNPTWENVVKMTAAVAFSVLAANYLGAIVYKCFALILQPAQSSINETQRLLPGQINGDPQALPQQTNDDPSSSAPSVVIQASLN